MLTSILKKLNGSAISPLALAEALAQLGQHREVIRDELSQLNQRRRTALLDDASDAVLDKIEREIDRANIKLEKVTISEQPLRAKLEVAQNEARRRRWDAVLSDHRAAAREFLAAARNAAAAHSALVSLVEQAQTEGFAREVASSMPATPNINGAALLAPDLLAQFEHALAPHAAPKAAAPTRRISATAAESLQHAVRLGEEQTFHNAARAPDDTAPLIDGEARVRVLRHGYSPADDRPQAAYGQLLRLPAALAKRAADHGAVEIVEEFALAVTRTTTEEIRTDV